MKLTLVAVCLLMVTACSSSEAQKSASKNGSGIAAGSYECWGNGEARMMLNFTAQSGGKYVDSEGKSGTYSYNPQTKEISFHGGMLDGVMPPGFHSIYEVRKGKPTVSFIGKSGAEASFCELVK